jgi:hypothetical protein
MKKILILFVLLFSFSNIYSQEKIYKEVLLEYMKAQGSYQTFSSTIDQMSKLLEAQIDNDKLEPLMEEMFSSLIDDLVPIYQNHLSIQDLRDAITMYNTPIGKKISEKTPLISSESLGVTMSLGMKFSTKIKELIEE